MLLSGLKRVNYFERGSYSRVRGIVLKVHTTQVGNVQPSMTHESLEITDFESLHLEKRRITQVKDVRLSMAYGWWNDRIL